MFYLKNLFVWLAGIVLLGSLIAICTNCAVYDENELNIGKATSEVVLSTIDFAGRTWDVKSGYCSIGNTAGPGPNYWCGDEEDVWVDAYDRLHMKMNYKSALGHYGAVSIKTPVSGCGFYRYSVTDGPNGSPDSFDPNVVLGLFTYDDAPTYDNYEIDIEISDWGDSTPDANLWYVTWEDSSSTNDNTLETFGTGVINHSFTWLPSSITFNSIKDSVYMYDGVRTGSAVYPCPTEPIYARINFWLVDGDDPASWQEVVIDDFEFVPLVLLNQPTGLSATATSSSSIDLEWNDTSSGEYGYQIERKESGGSYSVVTTTDAEATSYTDENLTASTTYIYRIAAVNDGDEYSDYSSEAQDTTDSDPDAGVDGGGEGPSLSSITFSFVGWDGYVAGTISDIPSGSWHARSWVQTNKMYREGKDLTVDTSNNSFYATNGLWGDYSSTTCIWVSLHDASTDVYGTGDGVTMNLNQWPEYASPEYTWACSVDSSTTGTCVSYTGVEEVCGYN